MRRRISNSFKNERRARDNPRRPKLHQKKVNKFVDEIHPISLSLVSGNSLSSAMSCHDVSSVSLTNGDFVLYFVSL